VIGDEVLRLPHNLRELADSAIASRELAQKFPSMGLADQLEELQRGDLFLGSGHEEHYINLDRYVNLG
jgi:hypothetical protein